MHAILIAGVALVGLPILLHLIMKQEPKRLTFPAFRFLRQRLKTNQSTINHACGGRFGGADGFADIAMLRNENLF